MSLSKKLAFTMTNDTITVVLDGQLEVTPITSKSFKDLQMALISQDWSAARKLASPVKFILSWAKPEFGWTFDIENGTVAYKGTSLPEGLHDRMLSMAQNKVDPRAWAKFWERVQANTSYRSVTQLYDFMAHAGIPITRDGMIMAYKSVRPDMLDHHSGTIYNTVGSTIEMPRNRISDDPNTPCHEGLHVGAYAYARDFHRDNRIIVLCEVDPADVVCVPYDCESQKVRCCKYRVISIMGENESILPDAFYGEEPEAEPAEWGLTGHEGMGSVSSDDDGDEDYEEDYEEDGYEDDDEDDCECSDCTDVDLDEDPDDESSPEVDAVFNRAMVLRELSEASLDTLRKIAGPVYGIKNASKIPGGRNALLEAILATLPK